MMVRCDVPVFALIKQPGPIPKIVVQTGDGPEQDIELVTPDGKVYTVHADILIKAAEKARR